MSGSGRKPTLPRLLKMLWGSARPLVFAKAALMLIQALMPGLGTYVGKLAVDQFTLIPAGNPEAAQRAFSLVLVTAGITVLGMLLGTTVGVVDRYISTNFNLYLDTLIIDKSLRLPLVFFDRSESYDQMQRARNGFAQRGITVANGLLGLASSVFTLLTYLMLTTMVSRWFPLTLLPLMALSLYLNMRWGRQRYQLNRSQTETQREVGYLAALLTGAENVKEVRLFGLGHHLKGRWIRRYIEVRNQNLSLAWKQTISGVASNFIQFGMTFGVSLWMFRQLATREITIGTYLAASGAVTAAIGMMPQVAGAISNLYEQSLYTDDLIAFLDSEEEETRGSTEFPSCLSGGITIKDMVFQYPGAPVPALNCVNLSIRAGERIALVGENGSGKSTLVKCLLGLYVPSAGNIFYDGTPILQFDQAQFRKNVTAVFQDFSRYALTIRENVEFGNLSRTGDQHALEAAAQKSGAMAVVQSTQHGWDAKLGRIWSGGTELSYGQWQKLAVARSLIRDAQVVVLDEPTAAMDPKAEAALAEQFLEVARGRTSVIVSHRLGTARVADRIVVMKQGRVVEEGTHDELIHLEGEYARMFKLQARWYSSESVGTAAVSDR